MGQDPHVDIASGALAPIANLGLSNTLRASLHSSSKTLSDEVGRDSMTSNVIVPGRIETDRTRLPDERRAQREGRTADEVMRDSAATICTVRRWAACRDAATWRRSCAAKEPRMSPVPSCVSTAD